MILAAWYHPIFATLFAFFALLLMGVILLQRGRGVGLSGAFGGAGGQAVFGSKTGDVLTWATIVIAIIFMTAAVLLNYLFVPPRAQEPLAPVITNDSAPLTDMAEDETSAPPVNTPPPAPAATPPSTPPAAPPSSAPAGSWAPRLDGPRWATTAIFGEALG